MPESGLRAAPRELVVASAGAGKTYRLSGAIIGLLDGGARPEEVFASTFTRKAAGEILDRVLLRLACGTLGEKDAGELGLAPERCRTLLEGLIGSLHAVNVGTLDAFFQRVGRAFSLELGLPVQWTLSDGPLEARLRSEAVSRLLADADRGALVELLRLLHGGEARAAVHDLLLDQVAGFHGLYWEVEGGGDEVWGFPAAERDRWGGTVAPEELEVAARAVAEAEVPRRASDGAPDGRWIRARDQAAERLREGDLEAFVGQGLGAKVFDEAPMYYRTPVPAPLLQALERGMDLARRRLGPRLHERARALGRLLPGYDRWIEGLRHREGLYQFDDVTRLLAGREAGWGPELHYRLDARIRHILLDEFQDTSRVQWWAIRPLVEEILSGYEGERGAVIVADPKQSIYGWRGGEPRIVETIRDGFEIPVVSLHESWRSSPIVLEFVNRVFRDLPAAGFLKEEDRETAGAWHRSFAPHASAEPRRGEPGHVRVEVGPPEESGRKSVRPRLLARAAERAAELHRACPGATVGVLVRTNKAVARLMGELRRLEVDASEEGGVSTADSPAVLSVLALLRMADHPGDSIARYQVARTPVRELVGGFDRTSEVEAARVAAAVRRRLAREGYGPVVAGWVRSLEPWAGRRDRRRLRQLAELAFRWDEGATLRPADFVRWVEEERVEDPAAARVRVMTVHQAKGLEFDAVIVPDLEESLGNRRVGGVLPFRPAPDARVSRIFPRVNRALLPLFPAAAEAMRQHREAAFRDDLSAVYVALTRARFALHVLIAPDPDSGRSKASSGARLVREALDASDRIQEGDLLFEAGSSRWWEEAGAPGRVRRAARQESRPTPAGPAEPAPPLLGVRGPGGRRRLLPRRSPSHLEGGGRVRLEHRLRHRGGEARRTGTVVHEWLRRLEWIEEGLPSEEELLLVAREAAPGLVDAKGLLAELGGWLEAPEIRWALSREAYPSGVRIEAERPFLVREEDVVMQGSVDRVVIAYGGDGRAERAWVQDYKTDRIPGVGGDGTGRTEEGPDPAGPEAVSRAVAFYRPQVEAYRRAVAREEGLPEDRVEAALLFLRAGRVAQV